VLGPRSVLPNHIPDKTAIVAGMAWRLPYLGVLRAGSELPRILLLKLSDNSG
jgi:hypothetical protein